MAARFFIDNGQTVSAPMSLDWDGCLVTFLFYDAGGLPVNVVGLPTVSQSLYTTGDIFKSVQPFATNEWRFNGPASRIKISLAGVTGYTTYRVLIWRTDDPLPMIPDGALTGLRAMTTQNYTEANVKYGLQFYIQHNLPQLPATTGTYKILFTTGAKPVLVKGREMYGIGEAISLQIYKQPTAPAPGGTLLTIQNFNDVAPAATTVTIRGGVTTTADGTPWGDPQRLFGQSAAGQRAGSGLAPGGDRILKANSTYLVFFRNTGSGTADIDYFLTWYEGGTDIPIQPQ